ncbi:MAG: phenylacetate--CoA ligase [Desulfurococcaceae archaeon]|nr:phenylacetate--CoA ligase [Desulfurococcaceae archaeon]
MKVYIWNPSLECLSRDLLEKLQLQRLKEIVYKLYNNSKYYRQKMKEKNITPEDIKTLQDITKLPFTTKEDLRELYPYSMSVVPIESLAEIRASSGTTGKPTISLYTHRDIENWSEVMARSLVATGIVKGDILAIAYNYHMFTGGFGFHYGALRVGVVAIPIGVGYTQRTVMLLKDLGVTALTSVPNYALRLAEVAYEMGIDPAKDTKVRKGVFGAAPWSEEMRKRIEKVWDMQAYDMYGLSELWGPGVAIECIYKQGLHVWEDHFVVEVVDPKTGEPIDIEEKGELVFTTLTKDAIPLIRYRTRDISRILDIKQCECRRTHRKIDRIQGRTDDMFIINGVNIWPKTIEDVLLKEPLLAPFYQIVIDRVDALDRLTIYVESKTKLSDNEKSLLARRLEYQLREAILVTPKVEIADPGTLPRFDGKPKVVIDRRGQV